MAGITGISSSTSDMYGKIASGKRINSAADDASGLTIAEKMKEQSNGLTAGTENAQAGKNVLNIADGALGSINDSLQRVYELSVKASNSALYSASDLGAMQDEISGILEDIQGVAKGTEYNQMKLLDGSMADMQLATNPDGTGQSIKMQNATLEALGIDGYDVTGDFDINRITNAIDMVSQSRSQMGASTNALESTINYNNYANQNTTAAQSSIEDLDIAKAVSEQKKNSLLDSYQNMMQRQQMKDQEQSALGILQF